MTGIASWDPEREINRDHSAKPSPDDDAGWLRYYAGGFYDADGENRGWGRGEWRYHNDCHSCHSQMVADKLELMRLENTRLKIALHKGRGRYHLIRSG